MALGSVVCMGLMAVQGTWGLIEPYRPAHHQNEPQILPGGEDWSLATMCSAAFPSSSHCWEVAVFGVLACIDCSKLSLVFLILLYPKTKNYCESAPSAPHNCRSLYNNFFRVYLKNIYFVLFSIFILYYLASLCNSVHKKILLKPLASGSSSF